MGTETAIKLVAQLCDYEDDQDNFINAVRLYDVAVGGYFAAGTDGFATTRVSRAIELISGKLIPTTALADDATNYVTVSIGYDDGAGGSWTEIQSIDTDAADGSEDWTAGTAIDLDSIDADAIPAESYLGAKVTHSAAGVLTAFNLEFYAKLT